MLWKYSFLLFLFHLFFFKYFIYTICLIILIIIATLIFGIRLVIHLKAQAILLLIHLPEQAQVTKAQKPMIFWDL